MHKSTKILVLMAFLCNFTYVAKANAATINASSCSQADVQSAINSASDGDTVMVPAGSCTWGSTVIIPNTKGLRISGAGQSSTIIRGSANPNIRVNVQNGYFSRIDNMKFDGTSGIVIAGSGDDVFRIDHMTFTNCAASTIKIVSDGIAYGLVDNCTFTASTPRRCVNVASAGSGGADAWYEPLDLGGPSAVYVEDCTITFTTYAPGTSFHDSNSGARIVIRHNTIQNTSWGMHDACPANRMGTCKFELYENEFIFTGNLWTPTYHRGGTGVIFNNTFRAAGSITSGNALFFPHPHYRGTGGACGTPWTTKCDSTDEYMCSDGAGFEYPILCTQDSDCVGYGGHCDTVIDTPGVGYPCRNQFGTEADCVHNPVVAWGNQWCDGGLDCTLGPCYITTGGSTDTVKEERDWIDDSTCGDDVDNDGDGYTDENDPDCSTFWDATNNKRKNYTAYTYPHPLRGGGNDDDIPPSPPSNPRIILE